MYTATADPLVGRVLEGRYRINAQLARGGMSTVYTAMDERLERNVAVKVMSSALSADPAFTDRFAREARSAAKLTHINAVSVYDQGEDAGHVFLVMELVTGRTLRELLREKGRLSPAEAVSIMEPVLAALAAAHRAGLIHRDIKPENILLSDDGLVKVADFGLARAVESDAASTRTGLMMGTVAYCSPEQISRGRTDQRSDVYSAGVMMFELLTGGAPYTGDSAVNVAFQHVHSHVPPPSSRVRGIAPALDALVLRATANEPGGRPLDAGAFLAELADVRNDLDLPVVAVPARRREPRPHRGTDAASADTQAVRSDGQRTDPLAGTPFYDTVSVGRPVADEDGPPPPIVIPPPKPRKPRKQRSLRARRRRRALIVLLVILLLGVAAGYGSWWFASGRYGEVPDISGRSQPVGIGALQSAGFKVDTGAQLAFSETVPKDLIISTDPTAGTRVPHGRHVELIVSKGKDRVAIPAVAGKSQADALSVLNTIDVQVTTTPQPSDTVPNGTAIGTNPAAGSLVKPNSAVMLLISTGPPILNIPDVTGKGQQDATNALKNAGFQVSVTTDYSSTVAAGVVISQDPAGDTSKVKFSIVTIDVSKGPQTVVLPQIASGTPVQQAQLQLQNLGLTVRIVKEFGGALGEVVGMDPAAGTTVNVNSTVTLYIV